MANFLLVHGGQHGSWCWDKLVPILEKRGHVVHALDLPGNGSDDTPLADVTLDLYARKTAEAMDRFKGEIVVVGHSIGGLTVSATAELRPDPIKRLVYLAAILPKDGQSALDTRGNEAAPEKVRPITVSPDGLTISMDPDHLRDYFYSDCSEEDATWAAARLTPQPVAPMGTALRLSPERYGRVPRAYIVCTRDEVVDPARQRAMIAASPCAMVAEIPRGHSPFLSAPEELADVLEGMI